MFRFAGIVSDRPRSEVTAQLSRMLGTMIHAPSEAIRIREIPERSAAIGWITCKSAREVDAQIVETDDSLLVFSGEHFTDAGPAHADRSIGLKLAASVADGDDRRTDSFLRELNGWFAGVLVDRRAKSLLLFNDRFGARRVYYSLAGQTMAFASEAKALFVVQPAGPRWCPEALGEFVACGCVTNNQTLFQDVLVLPPASAWRVAPPARITTHQYFSPMEWERQPVMHEGEFAAALRDTLARIIPRYLAGPAPVAVSLTGGIDSRVIMAFTPPGRDSLPAYTYAGMYRDCYDVRIAARVAHASGQPHHVLRLGPDFLKDFPTHAEQTVSCTDGTLDIGASHEVYFSRLARRIAPVRVTGNYGSEVLRGVTSLKSRKFREDIFTPKFVPYIREALRRIPGATGTHPVSFAAFTELPWQLFGRLNAAQSQLIVRSPYTDNELVALAYQAPDAVRTAPHLWSRLIAGQKPVLASIPTDMGHCASQSGLRTMPTRLIRYILFKSEWYYERGMPHWAAALDRRIWPQGHMPPFAGSHKIEHYRRWFRDELFGYLDSLFSESSSATPWVDGRSARRILLAHRAGHGNFMPEINTAATISLVHKSLMGARRYNAPTMPVLDARRAVVIH